MKKALWATMAALIMAGAAPATAQPGAGAGFQQTALASWVQMKGSTGVFYAADGFRFVDDTGLRTIGGVAKGKCTKIKMERFVFIECFAMGRMKELDVTDFQMDPALRSASMTVESGGRTHTVEWEAKKTPTFGQGAVWGSGGVGVAAGGSASASATADLFGKTFEKGCKFCYLDEVGGAGVSINGPRQLEVTRGGDTLTVELRVRIPR